MKNTFLKIQHYARAFKRSEDGNSTIEFVVLLPLYFLITSIAYEVGIMSLRQVILEHAITATVRDVRIGKIPNTTHSTLITNICSRSQLIPNCEDRVVLAMYRTSAVDWDETIVTSNAICQDRTEDDSDPLTEFTNTGVNNDLMFLRACILFDPMLPGAGIGKKISDEGDGTYGLTATAMYVMEPFQS
jgi:Flp pilus assembly protein TadG